MTVVNLTTTQAAAHLAGHERNDTLDQYLIRIRQTAVSAQRRNDTATLELCKAEYQRIKPYLTLE